MFLNILASGSNDKTIAIEFGMSHNIKQVHKNIIL